VWWKVTDVLEMITATFIRTTLKSPENIEGTDEKCMGYENLTNRPKKRM
jgi:hypothetical protein